MHECCEIFSITFLTENREKCAMECLEEGVDPCCYDICYAERNGLFFNNELNETALFHSITRRGDVGEEAVEVVKNSIKNCSAKINLNASSLTCNIPDYVYRFTQCVLSENFINCPKLSDSEDCQELTKLLRPCDKLALTCLFEFSA